MCVEMDLEFEKYCKVGRSPRTVLPSPRNGAKFEDKIRKETPSSRDDELCLQEGLTDVRFRSYRSVSCKSLPSRSIELEGKELLKRGSVYESSKERKLKRSEVFEGRKKIEFSLRGDSSFSFSILDSICGSDEEDSEVLGTSCAAKPSKLGSRDCLDPLPNVSEGRSVKDAERDMGSQKMKCDEVVARSNNGNVLRERDSLALNKSLSAKLTLPHSPTRTETEFMKGSPKSRFSPFKRMLDPLITKSKSHKSPLGEHSEIRLSGRSSKTLRKSLLQDFASTAQSSESVRQSTKKDQKQDTVVTQCSPAHLHGNLKLEQKHGVPYFEFSLTHPEEAFVAKTWKADDAYSWVYTFHSVQGRKKSNAGAWGSKSSSKDSPMVGQMQVSCYLCSELRDGGQLTESMVTEFVLYDISHARKSVSAEEGAGSPHPAKEANVGGTIELDELFSPGKLKSSVSSSTERDNSDFSSPYPWVPTDLHPNLEVAAVVVQVPFRRRESLKCRRGDGIDDRAHSSLLDLSIAEQTKLGSSGGSNSVQVNVVTPFGHHGLSNIEGAESKGPSSLLDRWRLGGGCDCGGWDMACPLVVFGKPNSGSEQQQSLLSSEKPFELSLQGAKDNIPALSIALTEKGQYSISFHARLSSLQAFAVCVAILHAAEASPSVEQEKNKQMSPSNSLKVLVDDEVKVLIEAATEDERRKVRKAAGANPNQPPFKLNPPFSPIARV